MNERIKELMRQSGALKEQPEQQPMVVKDSNGLTLKAGWDDLPVGTPLYTYPPRRDWRGLTEEEREKATGWSVEHIEAKLKEKNHE